MAIDPSQRLVRILEFNPDLGADLDPAAFAEARRLVACPLITLAAGPWRPAELAKLVAVRGRLIGVVVVEGLVVREVLLADRVCTHLHGPRDLIGADDLAEASLPVESRYTVPASAQIAVLDDRFLAASRRWPWLAGRMFDAATTQIGRACAHQAISQLPRVEDRLVALFWHLADRWGHVRPDGVAIDLPLTHEALGRLVGARRPTVSLGLQQLTDRGAIQRRPDGGWLLATASIDVLARNGPLPERLSSVLAGRGATARTAPTIAPLDRETLLARMARLRDEMTEFELRASETLQRNREVRERLAEQRAAMGERRKRRHRRPDRVSGPS